MVGLRDDGAVFLNRAVMPTELIQTRIPGRSEDNRPDSLDFRQLK
jgi:hypothetical protein